MGYDERPLHHARHGSPPRNGDGPGDSGRSRVNPVLFHPDYTVGSGLSPDLLTFRLWRPEALAGSGKIPIPPVGNCTPP